MAAINQIKLGSSGTTYDVNDKRITTTATTTVSYLLATDSSVSSIAPITLANLASALGVYKSKSYTTISSASTLLSSLESGKFYFKGSNVHPTDEPASGACIIYTEYTIEGSPANFGSQYAYCVSDGAYYVRYKWSSTWMDWKRLDNLG